jgi:hypothetical protein
VRRRALLAGDTPQTAGYCHCTRCQRRTGTSSSAQALVDGEALTFDRGEELVTGWRHPDGGMEKCFCRNCGAHIFSRDPDSKVIRTVRMSAFDEDPGVALELPRVRRLRGDVGADPRRRPRALRRGRPALNAQRVR